MSSSQQGSSFKNYIENVAIVGASGHVGKYIIEELKKTKKHKITTLTREDSSNQMPQGVVVKKVNYDNPSSLEDALRGNDVLIITMSVAAPKEQQEKLLNAAAKAGVPWVFPNQWGVDCENEQLSKDIMVHHKQTHEYIEKLGVSKWIGFNCGFWYEWSLPIKTMYGFDIKNRQVTFYDEGNTKINTSTWPQCGRAVASLLSLKILPDDENDKSTYLQLFANKSLYISSFCVSQKDMFESILRVTNTKESDWKIDYEPVKQRYQDALKQLQSGDRQAFVKVLYSRVFYPDGSGNFEASRGLSNEILGLPKENIDDYTKWVVDFAEKGGSWW